jgi:signal transduction histidine kinase
MTGKILIIEDEKSLRTDLQLLLMDEGYSVATAADGHEAFQCLQEEPFDIIITDIMMGEVNGFQVMEYVTVHAPDTLVIVITGHASADSAIAALRKGAYDYIAKPFEIDMILLSLERAFEKVQLQRDLKRYMEGLEQRVAERTRELEETNQKLHYSLERLSILDRLKTDFLGFISHELRTPLNAMAAVDLFDPHDDPQQQAEVIDLIRHGYERLQTFMQKGLDYFSWLASSRTETSETADLADVVRCVVGCMPDLVRPEVDFQLTTCAAPCPVRGAAQHLAEVVRIVLDNALQFSPKTKCIRVQLQTTASEVILTIADRGQGFPCELARELFQPFTITDVMHHCQGTGLNLALARVIVEAYGGQIQAHSAGVGEGATFTMRFPAVALPQLRAAA